jgi:hypothetical protein
MASKRGIPGLLVLVGIVGIGLGSGAVYFHYKEPRLKAELQAQLDAAPKTPEGRLAAWHVFGAPQIHRRITVVGRFSEKQPWLVTHAIDDGTDNLELWGVDCTLLPQPLSRIEGMNVVVSLPAPVALGTFSKEDGFAKHISAFAPGHVDLDVTARLQQLALYFLEGIPGALEKDIEGATLEIRVGEG